MQQLRREIRRLRTENAGLRRELAAARHEVDARDREIQSLRARLAEVERAAARQGRKFGRRKRKKDPKPPGRKRGHPPSFRAPPDPDRVDRVLQACFAPDCPCCGMAIRGEQDVDGLRIAHQFVMDVPKVKPIVTRVDIPIGACKGCGARLQGRHPEQTSDALGAAASQLGPNATALAGEMKVRLGMTFGRVREFFFCILGLTVTRGGLSHALKRLARSLRGEYNDLVLAVRNSPFIHSDATGWWIGPEKAALQVFANDLFTLYLIDYRASHDVVEEVLGTKYAGLLTTDCGSAYDPITCDKQKCLGHIIKDLAELEASKPRAAVRFPRRALGVLRKAIDLKRRRETMSTAGYAVACGRMEAAVDRLLEAALTDPDNARLQERMRKHREWLLPFLYDERLEPTNNLAERELRPAVIARKLSAGNRTAEGAQAYAILASVQQTQRRNGESFLDLAVERLRSPRPSPEPMWPAPRSP